MALVEMSCSQCIGTQLNLHKAVTDGMIHCRSQESLTDPAPAAFRRDIEMTDATDVRISREWIDVQSTHSRQFLIDICREERLTGQSEAILVRVPLANEPGQERKPFMPAGLYEPIDPVRQRHDLFDITTHAAINRGGGTRSASRRRE